MGPTGDKYRVLQLHPSRRCNLRCLHCYSTSGPEEREALDSTLLCQALSEAAQEGYTVAGISGGEPFLYPSLGYLLRHARACGMVTTVTTNGMLLDEHQLTGLAKDISLLAISVDGTPTSHNRVRASERAFDRMKANLPRVRDAGIPFGFIFTLTLHNLHELNWVAEFALQEGAKLLQIHPLELVGRARVTLQGAEPDHVEAAYAYLESARIQELVGDRLQVQLDLTDRELLKRQPCRAFAGEVPTDTKEYPLASLVSPVIIESDGAVVPIQHGFSRDYQLGSLYQYSFAELARDWRRSRYPAFLNLCQKVFAEVTSSTTLPFFNWYEAIGRSAVSSGRKAVGTP